MPHLYQRATNKLTLWFDLPFICALIFCFGGLKSAYSAAENFRQTQINFAIQENERIFEMQKDLDLKISQFDSLLLRTNLDCESKKPNNTYSPQIRADLKSAAFTAQMDAEFLIKEVHGSNAALIPISQFYQNIQNEVDTRISICDLNEIKNYNYATSYELKKQIYTELSLFYLNQESIIKNTGNQYFWHFLF